MDKDKILILKKIQEFRDKKWIPDYESFSNLDIDKSILKSMVLDGLIRDNGFFSLTEKGECVLANNLIVESQGAILKEKICQIDFQIIYLELVFQMMIVRIYLNN